MKVLWLGLLTSFVACKGGAEDSAPVEGTVSTVDQDATVASRVAYGFHLDGKALITLATPAEASCADVVEYFNHGDTNDPFDPQAVLVGGYCHLTLTVQSYDGAELSLTEADSSALWSLYCPMGEGSFEVSEQQGYEDYFWTGKTWSGGPDAHTTTVTPEGDDYALVLSMTDFSGAYVDTIGAVTASGLVEGAITARSCPELYQTPAFPK
ncbi:hypothetical protein L6R49_03915 [Myxococcota bacterium]|nr:hypothetical protein [Myxococcota bacterium]